MSREGDHVAAYVNECSRGPVTTLLEGKSITPEARAELRLQNSRTRVMLDVSTPDASEEHRHAHNLLEEQLRDEHQKMNKFSVFGFQEAFAKNTRGGRISEDNRPTDPRHFMGYMAEAPRTAPPAA